MEIWYKPTCSKCAAALRAADAAQVEYTLRDYLAEPPSAEEIAAVLVRLGVPPARITRFGEPVAAELGLSPDSPLGEAEWIQLLADHPELIQRPILLLNDGTAVIGRDEISLWTALAREEEP